MILIFIKTNNMNLIKKLIQENSSTSENKVNALRFIKKIK
jgi:hypothetical protein